MNRRVRFLKSLGESRSCDLSSSKISYSNLDLDDRYFERFDCSDEWNNLGYGRITTDGSPFSISDFKLSESAFDEILARFYLSDTTQGVYAGIKDNELIFNRGVGPIDGYDYVLIENFLQETEPVLLDIPYGYDGAVTMRIDCDEAIETGRELAGLYEKHGVPFSMAITTSNEITFGAKKLIFDVLDSGGSILSHSNTHPINWGGSRDCAFGEVKTSVSKLQQILPSGYNFDFVVSPFHQNPEFAVKGLKDAGIKGFVSGLIKGDPEYLVSRAGWAKNVHGIITHSQQCMLHGDCYHATGLSVYKRSFENHYKTNTFFGFLDHPFSQYHYGWYSEAERLRAHEEFIEYMKNFKNVWFANLVDAMSFLWVKVNTKIWIENGELRWEVPPHEYNGLPGLCVLWKNKKIEIPIS